MRGYFREANPSERQLGGTRSPRRILMVTPFFRPNIGGVETHLDDLCNYLIGKNHSVFVITYQPLASKDRAAKYESQDGLHIRRISWIGHDLFDRLASFPLAELIYLFPVIYIYTLLFVLRNKKNFDVIHTHGLVAALVGLLVRPAFGKRMVATVHTTYLLHERALLGRIFAFILSSYDRILFVSDGIRQEFLAYGIVKEKTSVFTYWVDVSRFKPDDKAFAKEKVGWRGKFVVLFVGRLIKEKGVDVALRTANMAGDMISFAFVTSGSRDSFEDQARGSVPANAMYVGPLKYSELPLYYNAADIVILPSQRREGFSRVVIEAAMCGTPIVASRVGSLSEVVNPNMGFLVDPPSPESFHQIIVDLFHDRHHLDDLSRASHKYASEHFGQRNANVIENSYYGTE
jgi:glycosyltransferase involved in cell wall biosynthesis